MQDNNEVHEKIDKLLAEGELAITQTIEYLAQQGVHVERVEWLRVEEYCKRFNIAQQATIYDWIKQGIIPEKDTLIIREYNHVLMIKAIPYYNLLLEI
jgi:hypothetical protein